jgi:isopenicillin-N N-acyltransferase-like protein
MPPIEPPERPDPPGQPGSTTTAGHTRFVSTALAPVERGREFGEHWRERVRTTVDAYRDLFARSGVHDLDTPGRQALAAIDGWAPDLGREIRGIAEGAALPAATVAAVNARTEILADGDPPDECSTIVALGGPGREPVATQNWDWFAGLEDGWLEWEFPRPGGGRTVTLTEFGVVGKIGVNDRGVGCLFNFLRHRDDGGPVGVPVHVMARRVLDEAASVADALAILGSARVSASTSVTVVGGLRAGKTAIAVELHPGGPGHVLPDPDGLLVRTNHFLSRPADLGDEGPRRSPNTLVRYEVLRRTLHGRGADLTEAEALAALSDHAGGVCVHPRADRPDESRTLANVGIDFSTRRLRVRPGPPCGSADRSAAGLRLPSGPA